MSSPNRAFLFDHRFLLFTGKGGVGKTTMVAALAVQAAASGQRPLVVELGHRASMRAVFGAGDIGFQPQDVGLGVHAMSIDIDVAVLDYMMQHVPSRRIAKSIMNNKVLERLFKAMPAVGEIATLNKLRQIEAERMADGRPRWAPILVDLDATGHALMLLELRNTLDGIMGAGPMRKLIESTAELLADPKTSRLSLVTTPEELPVSETIQLYARLDASKTVAWGGIYVNRVPQPEIGTDDAGDLDPIERAARASGADDIVADVAFARIALAQAQRARRQIDRLRASVNLPIAELPRLPADRLDGDDLARLGAIALQGGVP